ncbi:serine hydrolase domain-containing protein [Streptomyces europaeiscabiei]|uniref:serine hydrolase domain-containing protein n=1 Tax=Streptomyces europaeiscabiei TaxID=146819 RepID=UPI0029BB6184|nr:serine hydrolase domain-containing protein [Streptomyces europaeiscabiei]MDX2522932.1 serine hydrolase [Streptomyces europaeiscabiei]MDX3782524.1 serine hydrolase [Streptomyces europaeiscabiei]MDX3861638.1 serine hydrolase [Streptomyces europaeiscabiei]MDX3874321.1 serine hydrolase [Streptomyces europaeiscabiei]
MTITPRTASTTVVALSLALLAALAPVRAQAAANPLQRDADALRDSGVTGVSVRLDGPGLARTARSGVGDLEIGAPVPPAGYIRLGSTTKTYVATVVLQLVGEGRLSLEDSVERWLPGVVRGSGNDGDRVTVRQLLQHTSGLPDYTADVVPDLSAAGYLTHRSTTYTSRQRVAFAMTHPPVFEPGARWEYSNTNYILAGMVIEAVTGRGWDQEVRERILRPLRLTRTLTPGNDPHLPRHHARNYQQFEPGDGPMTDTTLAYLPFDGDADGSLIGTTADTNRFFSALLGGKLLAPAQLAEMRRTVAVPDSPDGVPGSRYGLGLEWTPLTCGSGYWGHSGSGFGYLAWPATMSNGRVSVTVAVHSRPAVEETAVRQIRGITDLIDHAMCAQPRW